MRQQIIDALLEVLENASQDLRSYVEVQLQECHTDRDLAMLLGNPSELQDLRQLPTLNSLLRQSIMDFLDNHAGLRFPHEDLPLPLDMEQRLLMLIEAQNAWRYETTDISGYTYSTWVYSFTRYPQVRPNILEHLIAQYTLSRAEWDLMHMFKDIHTKTAYKHSELGATIDTLFDTYMALYQ